MFVDGVVAISVGSPAIKSGDALGGDDVGIAHASTFFGRERFTLYFKY